jgi:hypothetical protein
MTALVLFKWTYVAAIFAASVQTALNAPGVFMRGVGAVEAFAVLLLLAAPLRLAGLAMLLVIFAIAVAHEGLADGIPFRFAVYAAGAWLIATMPEPAPA